MSDKEVKIGEKTIGENTKISLSVKMALWIISGFIFLFTTAFTIGYIDVKNDVKEYKAQMDKDKSEFIKAVEDKLDEKLGTFQAKDEEFIKEMGDMKGNIKVILDRTSGIRNNNAPTINNASEHSPPDM